MSDDHIMLRSQADRLRAQADEAEAKARREAERRAEMRPEWRVAELLHEHFARTYPGAGSAMDGGDPWYYELPTGRDADLRWKEAWTGSEHQHFVNIARTLCADWSADMLALEVMLNTLASLLRGRTAAVVRRKRDDSVIRTIEHHGNEAKKAIDALVEEAKTR